MGNFLSTRLFRVGDTQVTVSSLLIALAIIAASLLLSRLARNFIADRLLGRTRIAIGTRYAIGRVIGYLILFLGVLLALQPLGVNATTLAVFGGALGIGLGFGLQDIVKNFVAGLVILLERPIQVGDSIELGEVVGDVTESRARATVVRTNDDIHLIVPNSKFISEMVVNRSFGQRRVRYKVAVIVASGSDPARVEEALLAAAGRSENVLPDPPPSVEFREFGEAGLKFDLLCWTSKLLHSAGSFRSELNHLVYEALAARGIALPSTQLDVRLRSGMEGAAEPTWEVADGERRDRGASQERR